MSMKRFNSPLLNKERVVITQTWGEIFSGLFSCGLQLAFLLAVPVLVLFVLLRLLGIV